MNPGVRRASTSRFDAVGERLALGVHVEDRLAPVDVGPVDDDLAVEAAGAQQRRVEDVGPVGGGDQDHAAARIEAVHLDEQLVERLLALVVAAAQAGAAVAADRIDLVDEHDGRRGRLRLLEEVAHAAGADADEHLDEVRAGDREERHARLTRDGPGEQRLAGARRAVSSTPLGIFAPIAWKRSRGLEELLDLLQLLDRLVAAGDVGERDLHVRVAVLLGLGLAELHDAAAALHRVHQQQEHPEQQQRRAAA